MSTREITLQVNSSGAWKNVLTFDCARMPDARAAVKLLASAAPGAKFCFLHPNGHRDRIKPQIDSERDSMRTLNRALTIADQAARSDIECYAHMHEDRGPGFGYVYDLTRPSSTGNGETEESMALQVQIAQRAADHIRSRGDVFPWHLRTNQYAAHLVWFEDKEKARG